MAFVALPPSTTNNQIIFAKNSDRPSSEVQELVYFPAQDYPVGSKLQCTYIEVDQVEHTHAVILCRPAWLWGAEMGANEHGVCLGNQAVWTKLIDPADQDEKLLGMDLVRLGLERGKTAKEAMDAIISCLEKHGQGGPCSEDAHYFTYHNSFLIIDRNEAWVLETSAEYWAAQHITSGVRVISNELSIRNDIDDMAKGLKEHAKSNGFWDGSGNLDFALAYSCDPPGGDTEISRRIRGIKTLLEKNSDCLDAQRVFSILRDKESGICTEGMMMTTASMVSIQSAAGSCHFFTATPNPNHSVFKPFVFGPQVKFPSFTVSPVFGEDDPARGRPRFQRKVDRRHQLYRLHQKVRQVLDDQADQEGHELCKTMRQMEEQGIQGVEDYLAGKGSVNEVEVEELFLDCVETEMKFYQ